MNTNPCAEIEIREEPSGMLTSFRVIGSKNGYKHGYMLTRGDNLTKNQQVFIDESGMFLVSYKSVVAVVQFTGKVYLGPDWNYSRTTRNYVSKFLGAPIHKLQEDADAGIIDVIDLQELYDEHLRA